MPRHPYFQDHLAFLADGGAAMARAYPRVADHLGETSFDPDVERLLDGIAFLASKISERRDVALTEVCQLAFDILYPHYLCPLPACSMVELLSDGAESKGTIARGSEVWSVPVLDTACRFVSCYEVELAGQRLRDVRWQHSARSGRLALTLSLGSWLEAKGEDCLRLYLHGDALVSRALYRALTAGLTRARIEVGDESLEVSDKLTVSGSGFGADEALLAYPTGSFDGFRLIQEYFLFPEKFMFVALRGLRKLLRRRARAGDEVTLIFEVATDVAGLNVGLEHVRLNCTPVINLFPHTADPLRRDPRQIEHLVRPAGTHLHYEVYRVLHVAGWSRGQHIEYPPLAEVERPRVGAWAQILRRERGQDLYTYMMLHDGQRRPPRDQTLLVDILATNGQLPAALGLGDLNNLQPAPEGVSCRNIIGVKRPYSAPRGEQLRRRLVAHLALGQRDLTSLGALRDVIDLYNFRADLDVQAARANQLLLQSLFSSETKEVQTLHRRTPVWGRRTMLTLDERCFDTLGDMHLFAALLNEFIALQTPLNIYSEVIAQRVHAMDTFLWPKRLGPEQLSAS